MVRKNKDKDKEFEKNWQDFIDQEIDIKITKQPGHEGIAVYVNTTPVGLKMALARLFEALLSSKHMNIDNIQYCLALACNKLGIDPKEELERLKNESK